METILRRGSSLVCAYALVAFATSMVSCGQHDDWPPEQLALTGSPQGAATLELGRSVYERDCIGCHGPKGDGQGPAARFLSPRPRDFTKGIFKFAGVPAGELPALLCKSLVLFIAISGMSVCALSLVQKYMAL